MHLPSNLGKPSSLRVRSPGSPGVPRQQYVAESPNNVDEKDIDGDSFSPPPARAGQPPLKRQLRNSFRSRSIDSGAHLGQINEAEPSPPTTLRLDRGNSRTQQSTPQSPVSPPQALPNLRPRRLSRRQSLNLPIKLGTESVLSPHDLQRRQSFNLPSPAERRHTVTGPLPTTMQSTPLPSFCSVCGPEVTQLWKDNERLRLKLKEQVELVQKLKKQVAAMLPGGGSSSNSLVVAAGNQMLAQMQKDGTPKPNPNPMGLYSFKICLPCLFSVHLCFLQCNKKRPAWWASFIKFVAAITKAICTACLVIGKPL